MALEAFEQPLADLDAVQRCEADARAAFGGRATANRSQPYYLDVTNKDANKGAVVEFRDPSGALVYRSDPVNNTTVVAKNAVMPNATLSERCSA